MGQQGHGRGLAPGDPLAQGNVLEDALLKSSYTPWAAYYLVVWYVPADGEAPAYRYAVACGGGAIPQRMENSGCGRERIASRSWILAFWPQRPPNHRESAGSAPSSAGADGAFGDEDQPEADQRVDHVLAAACPCRRCRRRLPAARSPGWRRRGGGR